MAGGFENGYFLLTAQSTLGNILSVLCAGRLFGSSGGDIIMLQGNEKIRFCMTAHGAFSDNLTLYLAGSFFGNYPLTHSVQQRGNHGVRIPYFTAMGALLIFGTLCGAGRLHRRHPAEIMAGLSGLVAHIAAGILRIIIHMVAVCRQLSVFVLHYMAEGTFLVLQAIIAAGLRHIRNPDPIVIGAHRAGIIMPLSLGQGVITLLDLQLTPFFFAANIPHVKKICISKKCPLFNDF